MVSSKAGHAVVPKQTLLAMIMIPINAISSFLTINADFMILSLVIQCLSFLFLVVLRFHAVSALLIPMMPIPKNANAIHKFRL